MSDAENTKKSGYRLEYANSNRAKCKGPVPCKGSTLTKGSLKIGTVVDFQGHTNFAWRHWGCTTPKIVANMKKSFDQAEDLDGFDELEDEDKERIRKAWEDGRVADEDIPETARKADKGDGEEDEEEDEPKPKRKRAAPKKKEAEDGAEEKPKRSRKKVGFIGFIFTQTGELTDLPAEGGEWGCGGETQEGSRTEGPCDEEESR
ncbi:hypothetical protein OF83DRAFT_1110333 [Amylostereum chailletii]|nr:hypothetical protein OF83DRAFT_1110333 [Amylostereum chailletii]